ncbi:MAG: Fe3+/spermidine/putrescine ABC transporter ATP-binding protein [Acidobacteria bacterium]|nr:MAG: Fe3+/spermidine/putrescine ABC transporter ATP-binding protein [Acidobacteriota bacterium]
MIQARLRKTFPPRPDSAGFSLDLEFHATAGVTVLFGPSGSGKTLVLDSIAGFVRPEEGRILLDDDILFDAAAGVHLAPQARHCGYVFQNYALFPNMTLRQNLEFAAERTPRLERHRRVNEMLERFRLNDSAGRRPHEVSGGQRQRCSIARALIGAPKLLLLDEPAQGLDAPLRAEFYDVLRQVRADFKTPALLVTHDLDECFELGEEMLILREGKIVQSGTPRRILDQPANLEVARLLGAFNLLAGEIRTLDPGRNTSRVQVGEFELNGPYFPGRLKGDRVTVCVRPEQLTVGARNGRPGPNQIPAELKRTIEKPHWMRLEFSGGIAVDLPRAEFERQRDNKEWVIQFPAESLRVL